MFDEEKLIKKLQKIPRSKSLESRKQGVTGKLTQEEAKQWFRYKDGKLYWRKSPSKKIKIGDETWKKKKKNWKGKYLFYKMVNLNKQTHSVSHLVFLLHHGYYPLHISYVDKDRLNTNVLNLRASNASLRSVGTLLRNNTGLHGISLGRQLNKYRVRISTDKKEYSFGQYNNLEDAKKAYNLAAKRIYGEFAVLHDLTKEE